MDGTFDDINLSLARKISWRGHTHEPRPGFDTKKVLNKFQHQIKGCSDDRSMTRLVYSTPQILNNYLTGFSRCPFGYTEADTVILLESNDNTTKDSPIYSEIMEKVCKDYGKINVVMILPFITNKVAFYDPFAEHQDVEEWGTIKWVDPEHIFKLQANKLKNFHKYPINVSIFERYPTVISKKKIPQIYMYDNVLKESSKYSFGLAGFDAIVLGALKKFYNFGGTAKGPTDKEQYGHKEADGRFTGE